MPDGLVWIGGVLVGAFGGIFFLFHRHRKAAKPPRERRGFAGSGTVDPLKASKKKMAKK